MNILFQPFILGLRHHFLPGGRPALRTIGILMAGALLFYGLYLAGLKTITYFHSQNELGVILSLKIFQMAWVIVFTMLIFSSMVTGVSALFLSRDNEIIFAAPVPPKDIFRMRYVTTTIYISWMMMIFSLPVFGAFGTVFGAGPLYLVLLAPTVLSIAATATAIGLGVTILMVRLFPARRTRDIVVYLSLLFGILLYLVIRLLRPEELADPERFPDFIEYLSSLSTPVSPLLPPSWAAGLLSGFLQDHVVDWLPVSLLLLTPMVFYFAGQWIMSRFFFTGFSRAQESFGGSRTFRAPAYRPAPMLWLFRKEVKMFVRDSSQWSQLFLVGALIVVYLYNFKVLPLDRSPVPAAAVANLIAYANIGLTGFIIASLAARFVYPAIGAEGSGFGLILTAPLSPERYMLYKYLFYVIPFTTLALILLVASNHLLKISGPMWWISLGTGLVITWTVVAMALGFGAVYADFKTENIAAVQGSFGSILFLFSAVTFELLTIFTAALPTYKLVRSWRWGIHLSSPVLIETTGVLSVILLSGLVISLFSLRKGSNMLRVHVH